jgi:hypothetical protein
LIQSPRGLQLDNASTIVAAVLKAVCQYRSG